MQATCFVLVMAGVLWAYSALLRQKRRAALRLTHPMRQAQERSSTLPAAEMKVVVTGGCGFLGRHVVEQLVAQGLSGRSVHVVAFDARVGGRMMEEVTYVEGDVRDVAQLTDVCSGAELVVHCAAIKPVATILAAEWMESVNVGGTRAVLHAMHNAGVSNLIYLSSLAVVVEEGDRDNFGKKEDGKTAMRPCGTYARTKSEAERLVKQANGVDGLHAVILRPGGIYGFGDQAIADVLVSQRSFVVGDGKICMPWVWVRDCARGVLLAAQAVLDLQRGPQVWGRAFHLCNDYQEGMLYRIFAGVEPDPEYCQLDTPPRNQWDQPLTRTVPLWLFVLLAEVNCFLAECFDLTPWPTSCCNEAIPFFCDWAADITQAKQVLGWRATPFKETVRRILAQQKAADADAKARAKVC